MTQDKIIRSPLGREQLVALALEADIDAEAEGLTQALERFAALVRAEALAEQEISGKHTCLSEKQEPVMDYERLNALREGEQNGAEDAYFFVRPENDTPTLRKMFCQGFERGFHKGIKYAAPVSIESAVLAEREACAKVCEPVEGSAYEVGVYKTMQTLAAAIRARGE